MNDALTEAKRILATNPPEILSTQAWRKLVAELVAEVERLEGFEVTARWRDTWRGTNPGYMGDVNGPGCDPDVP